MLLSGALLDDFEDVITDGLAEGAALSDNDVISDTGLEGGAAVAGEVLMTLLVTLVLLDEVEVVAANDNAVLHLVAVDDTTDQTTTDGHVSGEGALLVDVLSIHGSDGGAESETHVLPVTNMTVVVDVLLGGLAGVLIDTSLTLIGTLQLNGVIDNTCTVVSDIPLLCGGWLGHIGLILSQ